ncbi:hypothetical protein MJO28_004880 [Puccinia striiformis f. sp. tritici]|uniref:Secreted protein n=2 Tax=Puccinia striiformis TaxID=27350 RepID=A0A2S4VXR4_9BASI|nr:hypothetical protein MJO28_004880 [Puccinia striiformis f. sp. tritici]POW14288.1 hypothetical protein PSTT_03065 [Puccinia striiformis]
MRATTTAILLAISLSAVKATIHTTCYNFFMQRDGCVFSAAGANQRCPAPPKEHPGAVSAFTLQTSGRNFKRSDNELERRYDSRNPSFAVAGGTGICGFYDSVNTPGVCLWSGAEQNNPTVSTAGWLNGFKTSNCGKRVYVQRTGQPNTRQYVKVLDGCGLGDTAPIPGCLDLAVTLKLFNLFNPTEAENQAGKIIGGLTWEFDNVYGLSTQQGPV